MTPLFPELYCWSRVENVAPDNTSSCVNVRLRTVIAVALCVGLCATTLMWIQPKQDLAPFTPDRVNRVVDSNRSSEELTHQGTAPEVAGDHGRGADDFEQTPSEVALAEARLLELQHSEPTRLEDLNNLPDRPQIEQVLQRFRAEAVDSLWSASTSARIYAEIANMGSAFLATDVECRTTLCRVQLTFPIEAGGKDPGAVSITAAIYGNALSRAIPQEELDTVLFSSGFNSYGMPIVLAYIAKTASTATHESFRDDGLD